MRDDEKPSPGRTRADIATAIVRLHNEYYGKGPTKAKAYYTEDMVVEFFLLGEPRTDMLGFESERTD
jgi:hypothetical protein